MRAFLARTLYYAAQQWRGEPVQAVLRELEASARWPAERLRELQWQRLQRIVRHAWETVPFYRQRWGAQGFTPGDLRTSEDWRRLPTLGKPEIQQAGDALYSTAAPKGLKAATSGSSGTPIAIDRAHASWTHAHANVFRGWRWWGVDCGQHYAYFWGVPLAAEDRRIAERKDRFFNRSRCSAFTLDAANARAFHERMRGRRATFAFGYPSAVTQFADELTAQSLDGRALGWKVAITSAEVLHDAQRERITRALGCPVADSYGCAEAGVAGLEHPEGGMRVPVESVMVDYERNAEGLWELVLTDLHNTRMPLLRYRVGDVVEPVGDPTARDYWPLPQGSRCALPLLGRVFGRAGDTLELPDGRRMNANLPSYVFKKHGRNGTVREYQFVQFPDRIELRVLPGPAWTPETAKQLVGEVREALQLDVAVTTVERFERRGRGKHRDFVRAEDLGER